MFTPFFFFFFVVCPAEQRHFNSLPNLEKPKCAIFSCLVFTLFDLQCSPMGIDLIRHIMRKKDIFRQRTILNLC